MPTLRFGRQLCGDLGEASRREWLVTDGLGGFAMGTVAGLRTRRYHGLLISATEPPGGRQLGLASLDPTLVIGDRRVRLGTHEWAGGAISPTGHVQLDGFEIDNGVPRWTWSVGMVTLTAELAMTHGRNATGVCYRLVRVGDTPVGLEIDALCTWRDAHGERGGSGVPDVHTTADGFEFEGAYRLRGPGFVAGGEWYRGVHHRVEAERGLNSVEDLWFAGRFASSLAVGEPVEIEAWSGDLATPPPPAGHIVAAARERCRVVATRAGALSAADAALAHAADQFIVTGSWGPTVVAGYPWFGDWSRDTMTSYEGLFLDTGREDEGRALLLAAAQTVSEGMLANTADAGGTEYNTVDGSLWFLHAIGRHVERTNDIDLAAMLLPTVEAIVTHHVRGTRFGIRVDVDGLLTSGADGWALTWMDARVDGQPITQRRGKPVEVNALWLRGLRVAQAIAVTVGSNSGPIEQLIDHGTSAFVARFLRADGSLFDVIDGPDGDDATTRPNQLLAVSLPGSPLPEADGVVHAVSPLLTSVGLRSLAPVDPGYSGTHRGGPAERDRAYHQGTVWPWLIGPYCDALHATGQVEIGVLDGLTDHLGEWGLGSVSETFDGDPPHGATGCPFQAWSVAELLRARRLLGG